MQAPAADSSARKFVVVHPLDPADAQIVAASRAVAAGVDPQAEVWLGMAHGFAGGIGKLKASAQALDATGAFLAARLQASAA